MFTHERYCGRFSPRSHRCDLSCNLIGPKLHDKSHPNCQQWNCSMRLKTSADCIFFPRLHFSQSFVLVPSSVCVFSHATEAETKVEFQAKPNLKMSPTSSYQLCRLSFVRKMYIHRSGHIIWLPCVSQRQLKGRGEIPKYIHPSYTV